jgi:hypothetical protein
MGNLARSGAPLQGVTCASIDCTPPRRRCLKKRRSQAFCFFGNSPPFSEPEESHLQCYFSRFHTFFPKSKPSYEISGLARIFHSETGKTMANPCSAGFPACRIAGFQTCVPCRFNHAFERVCAPIFIGFFATLSQMAMKYPGWQPVEIIASMAGPASDHEISGTNWLWLRTLQRARQTRRKNRGW